MSGFDINHTTISGNLTADPELKSTASGTQLCRLRIAHDESRKTTIGAYESVPGYYDVTVWGGFSEWIAKHLTKGDKVLIAGRLHWRAYQDSEQNKRQAIEIIADSVIPVPRSNTATTPDAPAPSEHRDQDIPFLGTLRCRPGRPGRHPHHAGLEAQTEPAPRHPRGRRDAVRSQAADPGPDPRVERSGGAPPRPPSGAADRLRDVLAPVYAAAGAPRPVPGLRDALAPDQPPRRRVGPRKRPWATRWPPFPVASGAAASAHGGHSRELARSAGATAVSNPPTRGPQP